MLAITCELKALLDVELHILFFFYKVMINGSQTHTNNIALVSINLDSKMKLTDEFANSTQTSTLH